MPQPSRCVPVPRSAIRLAATLRGTTAQRRHPIKTGMQTVSISDSDAWSTRSTVASPIVVGGRLRGAIVAIAATPGEPLPTDDDVLARPPGHAW